MELQEIERHARALMTAHGVGSLPFAFDNAKRRIGATHSMTYNKGQRNEFTIPTKITFSRHFAGMEDDKIREVILHEIAHALTPNDRGHGYAWKRKARELGIKPDRCTTSGVKVETPIKAECDCGHVVFEGHRLPRAVWTHKGCGTPLNYYRNGGKVSMYDMPLAYRQKYTRLQEAGLV